MSDDVHQRDLAKAALAYAAHQAARCARPGGRHGECSCDVEEFRRQAHLARGHALCPTCLGAREVPADDSPPGTTTWTECPTCDGLGNVDLEPAVVGDEAGTGDDTAVPGEATAAGRAEGADDDGAPPPRRRSGRPPALARGSAVV